MTLTVALCSGRRHPLSRIYPVRTYVTLDADPEEQPDLVLDLRTEYAQFPYESIDLLVVHHCPFRLWSDVLLWLHRVKPGGKVVWLHGRPLLHKLRRQSRAQGWTIYWQTSVEGHVVGTLPRAHRQM